MDFRKIRINQAIKAKEVRVVSEEGEQIGVLPIQQAIQKAQELGVDLVEISPQANPPVCKIIDFSKYKYLQEKKEKELRKHQRHSTVKEIYIRPTIFEHDLEIKLNHIKEFLQEGHGTKIIIRFTGREKEFQKDYSQKLIEKIRTSLLEHGNIDKIQNEGTKINLLVIPKKNRSSNETQTKNS